MNNSTNSGSNNGSAKDILNSSEVTVLSSCKKIIPFLKRRKYNFNEHYNEIKVLFIGRKRLLSKIT